ncbi:hypothetical protein GCM10010277_75080 [Streptomyces longisporoflavus]|nr:hypothetical protein GCM10010277_75080 [Streptomyces longisporoflavus]
MGRLAGLNIQTTRFIFYSHQGNALWREMEASVPTSRARTGDNPALNLLRADLNETPSPISARTPCCGP